MLCSVVYPGHFVAWITCMFKDYEDAIVAGMIKKGYTVSIVASDKQLSHGTENYAAVIISFKIETKDEDKKAKDIFTDLTSVLQDNQVKYYSAVISSYVDASWVSSNIELPKPPPPPPLPVPETDKNLN